jgi:DNA-binding HxlR family transcriptional regulator
MNLQTKALLTYLQQRKRLELVICCYDNEEEWITWSNMRQKIRMSDSTFRKAMVELQVLGLAERVRYGLDKFKSKWRLTDRGCCVASLLKEKVVDLDFLFSKDPVVSQTSARPILI